jgi:cation diffusion facilitator family transporter
VEKSEKVAALSIFINIALLAIKYTFAMLSGSVGLAADAIHSSSDVLASLTVFAGLKISRRRSKRFPYGLYKVENLASLIVAIAILLAGYGIAKSALFRSAESVLKFIPLAIMAEVVGGIYLVNATADRIDRTIQELKQFEIGKLALCHCTGMLAMIKLHEAFGDKLVFNNVGAQIEWN